MLFRINPKNESTKSFLAREGELLPNGQQITWENIPRDSLPVVLFKNLAGIVCSEKEFKEIDLFKDEQRSILLVQIEKLMSVAEYEPFTNATT